MAHWYCAIGDRQLGPLSSKVLRKLAHDGELGRQELIRQGEDGNWIPACRVKGLFEVRNSSSQPAAIAQPEPSDSPPHLPAPPKKPAQPPVAKPLPPAELGQLDTTRIRQAGRGGDQQCWLVRPLAALRVRREVRRVGLDQSPIGRIAVAT